MPVSWTGLRRSRWSISEDCLSEEKKLCSRDILLEVLLHPFLPSGKFWKALSRNACLFLAYLLSFRTSKGNGYKSLSSFFTRQRWSQLCGGRERERERERERARVWWWWWACLCPCQTFCSQSQFERQNPGVMMQITGGDRKMVSRSSAVLYFWLSFLCRLSACKVSSSSNPSLFLVSRSSSHRQEIFLSSKSHKDFWFLVDWIFISLLNVSSVSCCWNFFNCL